MREQTKHASLLPFNSILCEVTPKIRIKCVEFYSMVTNLMVMINKNKEQIPQSRLRNTINFVLHHFLHFCY